MRRSSDVKKQENGDDDERQAHEHQQEIQDQPVIRSRTVLKQSVEKDQQEYKQEEKDSSLEPPENNAR